MKVRVRVLTGKRRLNSDEQVLWENFTRSVKAFGRDQHNPILYSPQRSTSVKAIKKIPSAHYVFRKTVRNISTVENSLFIQHYKLFKTQQHQTHHKERFVPIGKRQNGLDDATWRKLQKGDIQTEQILDLHGFTAQHAFLALEDFLIKAYRFHIRCVEVITGIGDLSQGGGVLKRELPHWLNRPYLQSIILATVYVLPKNGGAVRILLKRNR